MRWSGRNGRRARESYRNLTAIPDSGPSPSPPGPACQSENADKTGAVEVKSDGGSRGHRNGVRSCNPIPRGAWRGSGSVGSSGLVGFFGLSGSENKINEINQIDQINQLDCL